MGKKTNIATNIQSGTPWGGQIGTKQHFMNAFDPGNFLGMSGSESTPFGIPQPGDPGYMQGYDPNTMSFSGELGQRLSGLNMDTRGLERIRRDALRKGASPWAGMMTNKSFAEEAGAKDRAIGQSRAGTNTAMADLAAKGGLSAGARERVARGGGRDMLAVGQDVSRQGNLNRMQIGINDEQNRITQLSALPGMENQLYQANMQKESMWDQAKQTDIQRQIEENNKRNLYNQNKYNQQMTAWAAERQAHATENSGGK